MRVAIRVDASGAIGGGHVMRCLTLAQALRRAGGEVLFLCSDVAGHLGEEIQRQGLGVVWIGQGNQGVPASRSRMMDDAAACLAILADGVDLLVVDHYGLDVCWERALKTKARRVMVIDDLANRHHECDLLLDQNFLPNLQQRYTGLVPEGCRLLLGTGYALLREEFYPLEATTRIRDKLWHLLIFFGGSDPDNLTCRVLRELHGLNLSADVVIGAANPRRNEVEELCRLAGGVWALHVQTNRMAELMARADLALGAGGGSHWERCLFGLPTLVVTVADNQLETTRMLHDQGACLWLGEAATLSAGVFRLAIIELNQHPEKLTAMSRVAKKMVPVDGGTGRVVEAIKALF